uniref:CUB_2 domain-containing protein n=1 Tax=Caenorhabditis japonica TaxID=281687 RepID=A0A8R1DZ61_CAEJA
MRAIILLLAIAPFVQSDSLQCIQIPDSQIKIGYFTRIPANSSEPAPIPPNFNCIFNVKVPPNVYAHVQLENQLKGGNDLITVRDAELMRTLVSSRNTGNLQFYVFPNTTTTFQVTTKSVDVGSKMRMVIYYQKVPSPLISYLKNNTDDLRYFFLNDLQLNSYKQPVTEVGDEKLVLTIAQSHWDADLFDNYYVIDGDFNQSKGVYHLSNFLNQNFISSGNKLTVLGLDNLVSQSALIFTPLSQAINYDSMYAMTTYYERQFITIKANGGKKSALTVIAKTTNETMILGMNYDGVGFIFSESLIKCEK